MATGIVPFPVSNVNPYEVCEATVPFALALAGGELESQTVVAVIDEQRFPVPVNSPYWPALGEPLKYVVDEFRYTYI